MAKKKAMTTTRRRPKKNAAWTKQERALFAALGVGEGDVALRKFIRGQRKINGRFYEAIDLILESLRKQSGKTADPALAKAQKINDGVAGLLTGGFTHMGLSGGGGGLWGDPDTDAD